MSEERQMNYRRMTHCNVCSIVFMQQEALLGALISTFSLVSSVFTVTGNTKRPEPSTTDNRKWSLFLSLCFCLVNVAHPLQVPMIVKALHKQLKEKSVKTRQCCFNMLTELVNVLPGALTQHIPVLIPGNTTVLLLL